MNKNDALEIFRLKSALIMTQWADRMKVFVVENKIAGLSLEALKDARMNPNSKWSMERDALTRAIKREVAGLVNRIHFQAYLAGIKR
jgi:phage FluMu gp28-like protein